ncbi:MAG: alpha/beta hydrolase [Ruminococcaceae bacterium]|nr:alpha/beta hydrolase [Oscillospiraceae bacterium]
MPILIAFCALLVIAALILITAYICFRRVFYFKNPGPIRDGEYDYPVGRIYEPYREEMKDWQLRLGKLAYRAFEIKSFDGLRLCARYYECKPGAPIELMFHGYQGNSIRDLSGGVFRAFKLQHNVLLIDHRAGGASEGRVITFGINEHRDCLLWIDLARKTFGEDVKLILTGVSMGAATVMIASGCDLPENVRYILADCGYSTAKDIIKKVIKEMKLPANILYPFVRLGALIFGKFDLEETSPLEAVKRSRTPILFIHGDDDDYVPCEMSRELYEVCVSEKRFVISPGAGHGLAYSKNKEPYLEALREFDEKYV